MLIRTPDWSNPSTRKLEAFRALQDRDWGRLLELTYAYLRLKSRKQARTSVNTLKSYRTGILDFLEWLWPEGDGGPRLQMHQASAEQIAQYSVELQDRGPQLYRKSKRDGSPLPKPEQLKATTVTAYLAGVRVLLRALEWAGVNTFTLEGLTAPKDPTPPENRRPALPESVYKDKLLPLLEGQEPEQVRLRVIVRLMGECGLRVAEVCGLEADKVDIERRLLEVKGKGGKTRPVPIPKSLLPDLKRWGKLRLGFKKLGVEQFIVNIGGKRANGLGSKPEMVRRQLEALYRQLELPERYRGAHMLRHTTGTRVYRANKDLMATARILGHADLNTAGIYAKMDVEGLLEAMDNTQL